MLALSELCEAIAGTTKKLQKIALAVDYLRSRDEDSAALTAQFLSGRAFASWEERTLQVGGALLWRTILEVSGKSDSALTASTRKHGDIGSAAFEVLSPNQPKTSFLSVAEVAGAFTELAAARGPAAKGAVLRQLLERSSAMEAKYIIKIITGDLRIGFKESLVEESIAKAYDVPLESVKRANMLLGDIAETTRLALHKRLEDARMRLFHPIGFMLATPAEDAAEAFDKFTDPIVEDKYDGIRAQVHVNPNADDAHIKIYSRTLDEISESFPELCPSIAGLSDELILDGEILAWRDGHAMPFSALQKRLGRKRVSPRMMEEVPVVFVAFDILAVNGELMIDLSLTRRREILNEAFSRLRPPKGSGGIQSMLAFASLPDDLTQRLLQAASVNVDSAAHLDELFEAAQQRGDEGLMIKDPASLYTPGRRGQSWLKLKRELATLDVVVTAVEFGHGKRSAVLSDYTFAVRDGSNLVNVGKAFTGLTDAEIAEMTLWFKQHTIEDQGYVRLVEPKVVIEVAFNAVMRSDRHQSGFALRFPRIVRLRPDKPVTEIDTLERLEQIYGQQIHMRKPG